MVAGDPNAAVLTLAGGPLGSSQAPINPADVDASTLPAGPGLFAHFGNPLNLYKMTVNFSTNTASWIRSASLNVASFTQLCPTSSACVPQPATRAKLDGLGDRLMNRAALQSYLGNNYLILSHAVSSGGRGKSAQANVRWYQIRDPLGSPVVDQQGTTPSDGVWRWMSSAAMNNKGELAVGYSASGSSVYPSLRYSARVFGDPANTLGQGEAVLFDGLGSQTGTSNRWGDYSDITVDPVDGCTFWYTNEYYPSGVSSFNWRTRIGKFQVTRCP
jgi:hypothetical protein